MRRVVNLIYLISLNVISLNAQVITGKIKDLSSDSPIEFATIGVVNTSIGTITDAEGNFKMDVTGQSLSGVVRISMISYSPQLFTIESLLHKSNLIVLKPEPTPIAEITIHYSGKTRNIGTLGFNRHGNWCGWGGSRFGEGNEIGEKISLGDTPVFIKSLHVHVQRQSYDSCKFRLHMRSLENGLPSTELLNQSIVLTITKESGWIDVDLSHYKIILNGDVALSLEWLKVYGVNAKRAQVINKKLNTEYVLFNQKKGHKNVAYYRWGTEAKWTSSGEESPSMYVVVTE